MKNLLQLLSQAGKRRQAVAPFVPTSNISPQENYAGYTALPNLPMGSAGDYTPDSYRMHAPFAPLKEEYFFVSNAGKVLIDGANEAVIAVPDQPLQQYFNQKKQVEAQVVLAPANGVFVPEVDFQRGWEQQFVPQMGMRAIVSGATPAIPLSQPIHAGRMDSSSGKRAPIIGAKAPKVPRG